MAEARDTLKRADLGTPGVRAVSDHSAQGNPESDKEAPPAEH